MWERYTIRVSGMKLIYESNRVFASDDDTFRSYARQFANTMFFSYLISSNCILYTRIHYTLYIYILYIDHICIIDHRYVSRSSIQSLE